MSERRKNPPLETEEADWKKISLEERIDALRQDCNLLAKMFLDVKETINKMQAESAKYEKSNTSHSINVCEAITELEEGGYLGAIQAVVSEDNLAKIKEVHERLDTLQREKNKNSNTGSWKQALFNLTILVISVGTALFVFMQDGDKQKINKSYQKQSSSEVIKK